MKKEYANCWNALTPRCPHFNEACMQSLLPSANRTDKYINGSNIDDANKLCQTCDKFSQKLKD